MADLYNIVIHGKTHHELVKQRYPWCSDAVIAQHHAATEFRNSRYSLYTGLAYSTVAMVGFVVSCAHAARMHNDMKTSIVYGSMGVALTLLTAKVAHQSFKEARGSYVQAKYHAGKCEVYAARSGIRANKMRVEFADLNDQLKEDAALFNDKI